VLVKKNTSNTIITVVGFDIVIMKIQNLVLALGLAGLGVVQQISSAQALSYTWSFVTDSGSTGGAGNTVSGTISGLNIGANNGNGLTISTSTTPNGQLENITNWTFIQTSLGGNAFTVNSAGQVTLADAEYKDPSGDKLFFGGYGGYIPGIGTGTGTTYFENSIGGATAFVSSSSSVPFDFNPTIGVILGIPLFLGMRTLKQRQAFQVK
jgi:hypothetical protein